jgi:glycerol-3-phosphate dehydrogenase
MTTARGEPPRTPNRVSQARTTLAEKYGVDMPIAREVYGVVHEGRTPMEAYRGLT